VFLHTFTRFYSLYRFCFLLHLDIQNIQGIKMKKVLLAAQVLAGLMLVVFGLNGFLHFLSMPAPAPDMGAYLGALAATGFIFPLISAIELIAGIAFLVNKYVALMVLFITPVMVNAFLAHLFLDPAGIVPASFVLVVLLSIIVNHKGRYASLFKA